MPNTRSRLGLIVTMKGFMTINSVQAGRVPATDEPKTASQSRRRFILGLTIPQFTEQLRDALEAYIRRPIVSVEVANYRPFYILGEVANPGTYPYSARLTVQNAVATAGGFSYRANRRRVYIRHAGQTAERLYELTSNTPVLPGDTVRVPERLF